MENIIHKIFDIRMFSNILFVDDNPAVVKSISIEKVGEEIKRTETKMIYNLDRKIHLDDDEKETIDRIIYKFFINLNFICVDKKIKHFHFLLILPRDRRELFSLEAEGIRPKLEILGLLLSIQVRNREGDRELF